MPWQRAASNWRSTSVSSQNQGQRSDFLNLHLLTGNDMIHGYIQIGIYTLCHRTYVYVPNLFISDGEGIRVRLCTNTELYLSYKMFAINIRTVIHHGYFVITCVLAGSSEGVNAIEFRRCVGTKCYTTNKQLIVWNISYRHNEIFSSRNNEKRVSL